MRRMYDSVDADAIPRDAEMVAGYVDGRYAWSVEDWARFPNAVKVRISAVGATVHAHVFDVEPGCIWPPDRVVPLVVAAREAGIDPTVYVNERNDWAPTKVAFDRAGVPHPHWWLANYDGRSDYLTPGAVARQYAHPHDGDGFADRPWETGAHYDLSVVADHWPGVEEGDDDMAGEGAEILEILKNWDNWLLKGGPDTDSLYAGRPVDGLSPTSGLAVLHDIHRSLRGVWEVTGKTFGEVMHSLVQRPDVSIGEPEARIIADALAEAGLPDAFINSFAARLSATTTKETDPA